MDSRDFLPIPEDIMTSISVATEKNFLTLVQISMGKPVSLDGEPKVLYKPDNFQAMAAKQLLNKLEKTRQRNLARKQARLPFNSKIRHQNRR